MNYLSEPKTDCKPMLSLATAFVVFVNKRNTLTTRIVKVLEFETKLMSFAEFLVSDRYLFVYIKQIILSGTFFEIRTKK